MKNRLLTLSLLASASTLLATQPAVAQDQGAQSSEEAEASGEIVVTARRRDETLISVPVVVTAVGGETLQNRGVVNLDGLSRIVPQLMIGPQGGSVQGGNISLRGIAGPDSNPFGDQAVSFTIDGVQVAKSSVRRMSDFDVSQVEVLKGPQALFYGKNSMGGIVNIRTNDPGDNFETGGKIGYETEAREVRGDGYISIPLGEGLGFRLAGQYSDMKGYLKDQTPRNSIYFNTARNPNVTDWGVRATLKFEPSDTFDARLKFNYGNIKGNGAASTTEFVFCPSGSRQFAALGPVGDSSQCGAGGNTVNAGYGPVVAGLPSSDLLNNYRSDGRNFNNQDQYLTSLVMNFRPSDSVTITSATGLYKVKYDNCQNYENSFAIILPSCNEYRNREFSQELNFSTEMDGPLNFSGGLYYSNVSAKTGSLTYLFGGQFPLLAPPGTPGLPNGLGGPDTPALVNYYYFTMKGNAYSAFLEATYKITDQLELSGGVRYSKEKKRLPTVLDGGGVASGAQNPFFLNQLGIAPTDLIAVNVGTPNALGATLLKDHDSWKDWSPEATLSYRPNGDLTIFASYKEGFLSGSFNSSSVNLVAPNVDLSYRPQRIRGGEVGVKSRFNSSVLLNVAAYTYNVTDLQVVNFTNATSSIRNAASARIRGFEADMTWRAPVQGLTLNAAMAYNSSKYKNFPGAPCYNGQTPAEGCVGGTQQLGGQVVPRSPKWNMQAGFNYDTPITDSLKLGLTGGLNHSSSYLTDASNAPGSRQKSYTMLDGTIRLGAEDDTWQVSLVGRNLTNKFVFFAAPDVPFTGNNAFGVRLGDRFASVARGREILLQVGFKFGQK